MRIVFKIVPFLLLFNISYTSFSQGCSDAGVCTINNIKDHSLNVTNESLHRSSFHSGITYGLGEYDISYVNPYIEYTGVISPKFSLSGKITYAFISGELANVNNLSDVTISSSFVLNENETSLINAVVGVKIPLNNSNIKKDENPLPMHYQSSLGTYDLIVGANYTLINFGISVAWQQPIVNSNDNEFLKPADNTLTEYKYTSTNSFQREGDVMLRVSYDLSLTENNLTIRPGLLGIYHLAEDSYVDGSGIRQDIEGSQGLTLNGNLFLTYRFSDSKQLELSVGSPFIARESRPAGLTRKVVAGLEYTYSF